MPPAVFSRIREAEAADPDGRKWPRAKRRDDVAVVHFSTFRRDGWGHIDFESLRSRMTAA